MPTSDPCQHIRDQISGLEDEIADLMDSLQEVPPRVRPGILRLIARLRAQIRGLNLELRDCILHPADYALALDGIEVTQGIQSMSHDVTLIAGKTTMARVYLTYYPDPPVTVRGELTLRRSLAGPATTVASLNAVALNTTQQGALDLKRRNISLSLNFLLPAGQITEGPLFITLTKVTNAATGNPLNISHLGNPVRNVQFTAGTPLRVRILGIRYKTGTPPVSYVPRPLDFGLVQSWLGRAYPVAQVVYSQTIVDAPHDPPFGCGDINAQVAAIRALDVAGGTDKRTHYFGLVYDGGYWMRGCAAAIPGTADPSAVASGPTGSGTWGWDNDGSYGDWYTGHELGHTFGRLHPGACGESHDDPSYPFQSGQLANADDAYVGFDVGDAQNNLPAVALPGTDWHDVMTYCSTQWLSSYTYEGIRVRLAAEGALAAGAVPALAPVAPQSAGRPDERFVTLPLKGTMMNLISVVATVNLTKGTGAIRYVHPVEQGQPSDLDMSSAIVLRLKRTDGTLLREFPVIAKPTVCEDPGADKTALVDALIPAIPEAKGLDLVVNGKVVATHAASTRAPNVRALRSAPAGAAGLSLTWESDARAGDRHTYIVQASTDDGATWSTLAVGLPSPSVTIDRSQFGDAKSVKIRVIGTDGFTSSVHTAEMNLKPR